MTDLPSGWTNCSRRWRPWKKTWRRWAIRDPESLRAAVTALETSLAALRTTVGALQSSSGTHTTDIEAVRQQLAQVQAALDAARDRIDALENPAPKTYKFGDEITFVNNGIELFKVSLDSYEYAENSAPKANFLYVTFTNMSMPVDIKVGGMLSCSIFDNRSNNYYAFDFFSLMNETAPIKTPLESYFVFYINSKEESVPVANATKFCVGFPNGFGLIPYAIVDATLS